MTTETLSNRMKGYEHAQQQYFLPGLPVIVRLDGKCFSSWTRGLDKPFDRRLMAAFDAVTQGLVNVSGARLAHTYSDEISLLLYADSHESQIYCQGKPQKLISVLASTLTVLFQSEILRWRITGPNYAPPAYFDARAFSLPSLDEAANYFRWRELDAIRNSIASLAQAHFSPKQLHGKSGDEMKAMMVMGCVFWDDLSPRETRGQYVARRKVFKELDSDSLARIPEGKRPDGPIERHEVQLLEMPPWADIWNPVEAMLGGRLTLTSSGIRRRAACKLRPRLGWRQEAHLRKRGEVPTEMGQIERTEIMRAEQRPGVYEGPTCDGRRPRWMTDTRSGEEEVGEEGILSIDCRTFPPGTTIVISVPDCPDCGTQAGDPIGGEVPDCDCGFDWEEWAGGRFS